MFLESVSLQDAEHFDNHPAVKSLKTIESEKFRLELFGNTLFRAFGRKLSGVENQLLQKRTSFRVRGSARSHQSS